MLPHVWRVVGNGTGNRPDNALLTMCTYMVEVGRAPTPHTCQVPIVGWDSKGSTPLPGAVFFLSITVATWCGDRCGRTCNKEEECITCWEVEGSRKK